MYSNAFAQAYEIQYYYTKPYRPIKDPDFFANKSASFSASFEKMLKTEAKRIRIFTLLFSNGKSKYSIKPYTILNGEKDFDSRRVDGYGETYKDFSKGYYVQVADFIGNNTAVKEHFDEIFDWKVDYKRDTLIYGVLCKRAVTTYNEKTVVAWYAPSIPIMDGPLRYAGLSGLILRLETVFGVTEVHSIQVFKEVIEEINIPEKKKYISFKEMKESRTITVKAKRIKKKE